jgi:hypothetical protein
MMFEVDATKLALIVLGAMAAVYWLINWVSKPVMVMNFDSVDVTTLYGNQRVIENHKLTSEEGGKKLNAGLNDFYVTITDRVVRYHTPGSAALLNPILRSSEDILFFRLQIRLVGQRIVRFDQTNLSKPIASLKWSKAQ